MFLRHSWLPLLRWGKGPKTQQCRLFHSWWKAWTWSAQTKPWAYKFTLKFFNHIILDLHKHHGIHIFHMNPDYRFQLAAPHFRAWCGDFQFRGCISKRGLLTGNKLGIHISAPCEHESNSHDVITAKHARNSRKVQEDRVTWSLQCSEIDSDCFEMFESQLGNPRTRPEQFTLWVEKCPFSFWYGVCMPIEETRRWNADWRR